MKGKQKILISAISATQRKLRHARATFQLLQGSTRSIPLDRELVERRLSDFLTAADSVVDIMTQKGGQVHPGWVSDWWGKRSAADQALKKFMTDQRNAEAHGPGARLRPSQETIPYLEYLERAPAMQAGRDRGYYYGPEWFGPVGMEIPRMDVKIDVLTWKDGEALTAKCERYLKLLEQMVRDFVYEHPQP